MCKIVLGNKAFSDSDKYHIKDTLGYMLKCGSKSLVFHANS